ncbi:hypothetical protein KIF59_00275 [Enterobacter cloacae subsp. cloacae]|nr:hypothetical protein [Enterobacter cloacae subsp. cloacae]
MARSLPFIARKEHAPPPSDPQALLAGRSSIQVKSGYPRPPDFTGTAFLEQLLLTPPPRPDALKRARPMTPLHRLPRPALGLPRYTPPAAGEGKDFPPSPARMDACSPAAVWAYR